MPILLKDMKVGMHDKVAEQVVDSFIRHSEVLELLPFDNAVSPSGGQWSQLKKLALFYCYFFLL